MNGRSSIRVCALVIASVAVSSGCAREDGQFAVGTLERDRIELAAESDEPIVAIHVDEGDAVTAGARIVSQDPSRAEARLAQARSARDEAVAMLEEAVAGPRAQEIAQGEARLAAADSGVITARQALDREKSLLEQGFGSRSRLDVLEGAYAEALARRREARAALDELQEGTRSEVVRRARESLAGAEARVRELEIQLARTHVTAPMDATVEALPLELGERPSPGQTVVVLRAVGPTFARIYVPEPLRARLSVGSPAEVWIDGADDALAGEVRWISTEAAFTPYFALTQRDRSRLSYLAEVRIRAGDDPLPVGVPVEVRFPAVAQ